MLILFFKIPDYFKRKTNAGLTYIKGLQSQTCPTKTRRLVQPSEELVFVTLDIRFEHSSLLFGMCYCM